MAKSRGEKFLKKQQGTLFAFGGLAVIGFLLYSAFKNKDDLRDSLLDRITGGGGAAGTDGQGTLPEGNGIGISNEGTQQESNYGNTGSLLDSIKQIVDSGYQREQSGGSNGSGAGGYGSGAYDPDRSSGAYDPNSNNSNKPTDQPKQGAVQLKEYSYNFTGNGYTNSKIQNYPKRNTSPKSNSGVSVGYNYSSKNGITYNSGNKNTTQKTNTTKTKEAPAYAGTIAYVYSKQNATTKTPTKTTQQPTRETPTKSYTSRRNTRTTTTRTAAVKTTPKKETKTYTNPYRSRNTRRR